MIDSYRTAYGEGRGEIVEKKSRFIAEIFPVETEEEAALILERVRKEYWDARHHCWAYRIRGNPPCERMSDDGEPSGTAGKPILEVLRGRGLTDVLAVVTRYFGGTLLGTGGLVRAYTAAVTEGLARTDLITRTRGMRLSITTDYTSLGKIQYLAAGHGICTEDTVYSDKVEMTVIVPGDTLPILQKEIREGTNGQSVLEEKGECWLTKKEGTGKEET